MPSKVLLIFVASAALCTVAATHRFRDSAHSIGIISAQGGKARHPIQLEAGLDSYTLIATATVIPPYRGDVRVAVEGEPPMDIRVYNSEPAIDLNPYHHPVFRDGTLYDLRPRDRIAMWVVMTPVVIAPEATGAATTAAAKVDCCVADDVVDSRSRQGRDGGPEEKTAGLSDAGRERAKQFLTFSDTETRRPVLRVPITYLTTGGGEHGEGH